MPEKNIDHYHAYLFTQWDWMSQSSSYDVLLFSLYKVEITFLCTKQTYSGIQLPLLNIASVYTYVEASMHMLLISVHQLYRCVKKAESQYIQTFLNKDDIVAI